MAVRRELLQVAVVAALLLALLPATALAGPQWLGPDPLEAAGAFPGAPDLAADAAGNSAAVWAVEAGEVRAAVRPHGGPWGDPVTLETGTDTTPPLIVAEPGGDFVAVWTRTVAGTDQIRWAHRPADGGWSQPATIAEPSCCPELAALEAGALGGVTVIWRDEGAPSSNTKPARSNSWGNPHPVPSGNGDPVSLAIAPNGSAVVAFPADCGSISNYFDCVQAAYREGAADDWSAPEPVGITIEEIRGVALVARSDSSFSVVWAEGPAPNFLRGQAVILGVQSADRPSGPTSAWTGRQTDAQPLGVAAGCPPNFVRPFGCLDLAVASDDTLLAVWQQDGGTADEIAAALRPPTGGAWDQPETLDSVFRADADPQAAFTGNAIPVAAWRDGSDPLGPSIRGAHRDANGWTPVPLSPATTGQSIGFRSLAGDGEGNAVTGWNDAGGVSAAGFDGVGPLIDPFSVPATGTAGTSLPFSAAAEDNWSALAGISWLFGDGAVQAGGDVQHAYAAPGDKSATVTATDAIDNASQRTGTTAVAAATPIATPTVAPTATVTPPTDPCGTTDRDQDAVGDLCDRSNGDTAPVPFKTLNARVVSGDVFVKRPAGSASASQRANAPKGFVRLQGAETIPFGSTLDTAKGRVQLRTAADTRKHVQLGQFYRGRFVVRQVRKPRGKAKRRSPKLFTVLKLTGSSFSKACKNTASISARRRSRKRVRRLFGDGKGRFRTGGRNAAATVRGTRWGVQDRCDGTLVVVQRGRVSVRDLVRRRTVIVKAGHKYLARRR